MRDIFTLHLAAFSISFSFILACVLFLFGANISWMTLGLLVVISLILSPFVTALLNTLV